MVVFLVFGWVTFELCWGLMEDTSQ
jgi:hypothetical protein